MLESIRNPQFYPVLAKIRINRIRINRGLLYN